MDAVIYTRYSTENQTENSTDTQITLCKQFAERKGMSIIEIYSDEAESGMKMQRTRLPELLEDASRGNFQAVIIYDQSRLSRDIVDWFTLRNTLESLEIGLYSVQSDKFGDVQDPTNFMMESVQAVFNQMHVLTTRKKVIEGMRNIAGKGQFTGGVPCLGYKSINKELVIDDDEAEIVRIIFSMYAEGVGYNPIIDFLNAHGCLTKAGKTFGKNSLYSILCNEKYIGNLTYGKVNRKGGKRNTHAQSETMIRVENAVPPIISKEMWDVVRAKARSRKWNASGKAKVQYFLVGKIFCGECGAAMCGNGQRRNYFYYGCSGAQRLRNCDKRLVRKEYVEENVLSRIREYLTPEHINEVSEALYRSMQGIQDSTAPLKDLARKELRKVQSGIENINNAIADGVYSSSTVVKLKALEDRQMDLIRQLSDLDKAKVETKKSPEEIKSVLNHALAHSGCDKMLINLMVEKVICYNNGEIHVVLNPLGVKNCVDTSGAAEQT